MSSYQSKDIFEIKEQKETAEFHHENISTMKTLIIILLASTTTLLTAQTRMTWKGGTPGKETSWEEPRNWENQRVPNEFSVVIIKQINSGHNAQPIIKNDAVVAAIEIHAGATLTIAKTGNLLIDGEYTYSEGLSEYGGQLKNTGTLAVKNIASEENYNDYAKASPK